MINFKISAPGRIVLAGEHSAMYGKYFFATSLNRRTNLEFYELPDEPRTVQIEFPDIDLELNIPLETIESYFTNPDLANIHSNSISLLQYVKYFISINDEDLKRRPFRVRVSTELPICGGLGSSISFAVCLAACFVHWKQLQTGDHLRFNDQELNEIENYTTFCEYNMLEYTFVSVDSKVCTYGQMTKCQRTSYINYSMQTMDFKEMMILLINSNIVQSKNARAKEMAELLFKNSKFDSILNTLNVLAVAIYDNLNSINNTIENPNELQEFYYIDLRAHIMQNQQFLQENNLSNWTFDNICSIANMHGFAGKLAGFGGGYLYILIPPNATDERIINISNYLINEGYIITVTSINCEGVRID